MRPSESSMVWLGGNLLPYALLAFAYALVTLSSPMPSHPGWVEAVMGLSLITGCASLAYRLYQVERTKTLLRLGVMMFGLLLPLLIGWLYGHSLTNIIRDLFPVAFLLFIAPLVLLASSQESAHSQKVSRLLIVTTLFVGVTSASHCLLNVYRIYGSFGEFSRQMTAAFAESGKIIEVRKETTETTHERKETTHEGTKLATTQADPSKVGGNYFQTLALLAYEPALLFSAIYGLLMVLENLLKGRRSLELLVGIVVGLLCTYTLSLFALRAAILLVVLSAVVYVVAEIRFSRKNLHYLVLGIAFLALLGTTLFQETLRMLLAKQHAVGSSGKLTEFLAVIAYLQSSVAALLLGAGWGGELSNPIYGNEPTRYTHSLISFLLFKTGLSGLAIYCGIFLHLLSISYSRITTFLRERIRDKTYLAAGAALLIGLTTQPTYKMLGYSVVLTLFLLPRKNNTEVNQSELVG